MTFIRLRRICLLSLIFVTWFAFATPSIAIAQSDAWIRGEVRKQLMKNDLKPFLRQLQIRVDQGVVTLSGRVPTEEERLFAEQLALKVSGVTRVDNQLEARGLLGGAPPVTSEAVEAGKEVTATMAGNLVFRIIMGVVGTFVMFIVLAIFLMRRKSVEDQQAYQDMLGNESVRTVYDPAEYQRTMAQRDRKR